jgi:hypothetical protein
LRLAEGSAPKANEADVHAVTTAIIRLRYRLRRIFGSPFLLNPSASNDAKKCLYRKAHYPYRTPIINELLRNLRRRARIARMRAGQAMALLDVPRPD